jgi:serine/threonine-protein kinase RsbW
MDAICLPGIPDSLGKIRSYVRASAEKAGLDKKRAYHLMLAVDEIATNIVVYGYKNGTLSGDVEVEVDGMLSPSDISSTSGEPARFVVTLKDTAPPFDPLSRKMPDDLDLRQPLQDRSVGGLGIFLAIMNVDEFLYSYAEGKNHNIFVVKARADGN